MHKSDIAEAYCNIPMDPLWQLKQAVVHGNSKHVDRCNCFGCRGSYYVYIAFISLICWIAKHVKHIQHLKWYIDDNCSFAQVGDIKYYSPYGRYFPSDQTELLKLWDEIGLPHVEKKQIYGPTVTFIGFDVDPNAMTISISHNRKQALLDQVVDFAQPGKRRMLKDFQSIAGRINWSLAVFPLLKPCLSAVYAKMAGKSRPLGSIRINNAIRDELLWFAKHASQLDGIFLLNTVAWDPTFDLHDTIVGYADACPQGMGFWFPEFNLGFQCHVPEDSDPLNIFYYEALAVTCCMLQGVTHSSRRLVVYSDNHNTVDVWNSLKASAPYNHLLIIAIDALIERQVDARVLHIPGDDNTIADALSRFNNVLALELAPQLRITNFTPPRGTLGAVRK
jgi:hypothetical protein